MNPIRDSRLVLFFLGLFAFVCCCWQTAACLLGRVGLAALSPESVWRCVSFGPSFGVAVDDFGRVAVWGVNSENRPSRQEALLDGEDALLFC